VRSPARQPSGQKVACRNKKAAWNVPFLLNANISEDVFRAVKTEAGYECSRRIRNLVKYDIRSPGVLYGTNNGILLCFASPSGSGRSPSRHHDHLGRRADARTAWRLAEVNYSCEVDLTVKKDRQRDDGQGLCPSHSTLSESHARCPSAAVGEDLIRS